MPTARARAGLHWWFSSLLFPSPFPSLPPSRPPLAITYFALWANPPLPGGHWPRFAYFLFFYIALYSCSTMYYVPFTALTSAVGQVRGSCLGRWRVSGVGLQQPGPGW